MFGSKNILTIWVSGKQLVMAGGGLTSPETIMLPANVVSNLEVVNHEALYALIKEWTDKHKAMKAEIVWIYGPDVSFEHVMQEGEEKEWDSVVMKFLDLLPFEEVESRTYMNTKATKVVAINRDLDKALKRAFALQGYNSVAEVAAADLTGVDLSSGFTNRVSTYVAKNADKLMRERIVSDSFDSVSIRPPSEEKKKSSSLPLLIGVFAVLLVVLGLMIWRTYG